MDLETNNKKQNKSPSILLLKNLNPEQIKKFKYEAEHSEPHLVIESPSSQSNIFPYSNLETLDDIFKPKIDNYTLLRSLDDLLERDKQRERDGFPRKIRIGRIIKPGKNKKNKVIVVPSTVEEKLYHDRKVTPQEEAPESGGSGDGEEGEIIGEQPVQPSQNGEGQGAGQGDGENHELESNAYDLGKILTEQFELPNLKEKGKKRSLTKYSYELTDKQQRYGQLLDKKATLKRIVKTNIALNNIPKDKQIDPSNLILSPDDKIYRILSKEKSFESQAVVFFIRDYSASMTGDPTQLIVTQHVMIYSWLLYQYSGQVESRFILQYTEAKEVTDFYTYYNSQVAGGTRVAAGYKKVNEIIRDENLDNDYNIYIFHGTDGDDWDTEGNDTLPELKEMLNYANRIGISIAQNEWRSNQESEVEKYIKKSDYLQKFPDLLKIDVLPQKADEARLIKGIKKIIS